ncbi:hypothetical protein G7046_g6925 [Stylonectria norvegica]|nr:hypothetical protein G7046_g6925 [Stylonectria norvegica]
MLYVAFLLLASTLGVECISPPYYVSGNPSCEPSPKIYPFLYPLDYPATTCMPRSLRSADLANATTQDCVGLLAKILKHQGHYVVGGFDVRDEFVSIISSETCHISVKPVKTQDKAGGAKWYIGDVDLYSLVVDSIYHTFNMSRAAGAAEGVVPCRWVRGVDKAEMRDLHWRVWNSDNGSSKG